MDFVLVHVITPEFDVLCPGEEVRVPTTIAPVLRPVWHTLSSLKVGSPLQGCPEFRPLIHVQGSIRRRQIWNIIATDGDAGPSHRSLFPRHLAQPATGKWEAFWAHKPLKIRETIAAVASKFRQLHSSDLNTLVAQVKFLCLELETCPERDFSSLSSDPDPVRVALQRIGVKT